jgi:hypothetical protein
MTAAYNHVSLIPAVLALLLAVVAVSPAAAQNDQELLPLFDSQETLQVRITAPFTTLMRDRDSDAEQDGRFHVIAATGAEQTFDVKIRTRGHYRGDPEHCQFAPLRLNFKKKQVRQTVFHGEDKLKLVTHCENSGMAYEQSLLREYLAYRMLNLLTDLSFRVRLLHVDYVDTEKDSKTRSKYAVLIEDDEALAERINLAPAALKSVRLEQLDARQTALLHVFEYLIGNTDFSAVRGAADAICCHNVTLFVGPDGALVPIPYDFDLAGLVDAPYATPNPKLKIREVTQRLYRGYCDHNELLDEPITLTIQKRAALLQLIEDQSSLSKASKRKTVRFVDQYYDRVASRRQIDRYLAKDCQ